MIDAESQHEKSIKSSDGSRIEEVGRQGIVYLLVGGASAIIELAIFQTLYALAGLGVAEANIIALLASTVFNFIFNRSVTFKSTSNPVRSMILYGIIWLANAVISTVAITAMVGASVPSPIAKVIMQACVAIWDFFLYRAVVFK